MSCFQVVVRRILEPSWPFFWGGVDIPFYGSYRPKYGVFGFLVYIIRIYIYYLYTYIYIYLKGWQIFRDLRVLQKCQNDQNYSLVTWDDHPFLGTASCFTLVSEHLRCKASRRKKDVWIWQFPVDFGGPNFGDILKFPKTNVICMFWEGVAMVRMTPEWCFAHEMWNYTERAQQVERLKYFWMVKKSREVKTIP